MSCRFYVFLLVFASIKSNLVAQTEQFQNPPRDWFLKEFETDHLPGLSIERMYSELLQGRTSKTVVVAVIDTGVDIDHEDLKEVIWVNDDEIPNNGIDDDHNGYIDDVNGWNFIGGKAGNVNEDTYEVTRQYVLLKKKYANLGEKKKLSKKEKEQYAQYLDYKKRWEKSATKTWNR